MDNSKVTVLIISNDDNETKTFELKTKHVKNFQKYIIGASAFAIFCIMGFAALFAYTFHINSKNSDLHGQLVDANEQIEIVSENKVKEKLNSIDQSMLQINTYLQQRGALQEGNIGGEVSQKDENVYSRLNFYEKQSVVFLNKLVNMPVGYPYNGPVSSGYGYRTNPFGGRSGEFHPGIDFKGQIGDPIYATGNGIVNRCDWYNGYGNAVLIDHEYGLQTLFGHMSKVNVIQGQVVHAGDLIGFLGTTGRSTGPHVHYEIRKDGDDIDPLPFLKLNN